VTLLLASSVLANTTIPRFHERIDAIGKQPKGEDAQQHWPKGLLQATSFIHLPAFFSTEGQHRGAKKVGRGVQRNNKRDTYHLKYTVYILTKQVNNKISQHIFIVAK
jgi:hypothetical protein